MRRLSSRLGVQSDVLTQRRFEKVLLRCSRLCVKCVILTERVCGEVMLRSSRLDVKSDILAERGVKKSCFDSEWEGCEKAMLRSSRTLDDDEVTAGGEQQHRGEQEVGAAHQRVGLANRRVEHGRRGVAGGEVDQ